MRFTEDKAIRLVKEGRVHVRWTNGDAGHGIVDGDTDTYSCFFSPEGRACTCPAGRTHRGCSHSLALELKVAAGDALQLEFV